MPKCQEPRLLGELLTPFIGGPGFLRDPEPLRFSDEGPEPGSAGYWPFARSRAAHLETGWLSV